MVCGTQAFSSFVRVILSKGRSVGSVIGRGPRCDACIRRKLFTKRSAGCCRRLSRVSFLDKYGDVSLPLLLLVKDQSYTVSFGRRLFFFSSVDSARDSVVRGRIFDVSRSFHGRANSVSSRYVGYVYSFVFRVIVGRVPFSNKETW